MCSTQNILRHSLGERETERKMRNLWRTLSKTMNLDPNKSHFFDRISIKLLTIARRVWRLLTENNSSMSDDCNSILRIFFEKNQSALFEHSAHTRTHWQKAPFFVFVCVLDSRGRERRMTYFRANCAIYEKFNNLMGTKSICNLRRIEWQQRHRLTTCDRQLFVNSVFSFHLSLSALFFETFVFLLRWFD